MSFSALQRAEIAEMLVQRDIKTLQWSFSALQRAEIAEMSSDRRDLSALKDVSVLFNEPKLLKSDSAPAADAR